MIKNLGAVLSIWGILGSASVSMAQFPAAQPTRTDLERNQAQAKEVARTLQDRELSKISSKFSAHSNEVIGNNPDAVVPATALSLGAMFWIGHKVNLIKSDDLKLSSRLEGRGRCGSLNLDAPLFNGKLNFAQSEGLRFGINKRVEKINSDAEVNYKFREHSVSTEIRHRLTERLAVCVGMNQAMRSHPEQNARIQYNVNF